MRHARSQRRLWENLVGRGRPFCAWALPRLAAQLPGGLDGTTVDELYRGVNAVHRSLIRGEADETTYNLHIALRFELELALMEGALAVAPFVRYLRGKLTDACLLGAAPR